MLEIIIGSTPTLNFIITQNGSPLSLTGKTIHVGAKADVDDTEFIFDKTTTNGDADGKFSITLTSTDTDQDSKQYKGGVKIEIDATTFLMAKFDFKMVKGVYS